MAGVSPYEDFTPAELYYMGKAKSSRDWDHTSCILAMLYNANAKNKKRADHFHPYRDSKPKKGNVSLYDLKAICKRGKNAVN